MANNKVKKVSVGTAKAVKAIAELAGKFVVYAVAQGRDRWETDAAVGSQTREFSLSVRSGSGE